MARVGPNQDINDFDTILSTANSYQTLSATHGILVAQSAAENPSASGPPIVDISIPLKMSDGSTQLLDAADIGSPEVGELVSNATIITYVDLPERFREYWELLNASLGEIVDYKSLNEEDIDPEIIFPGGGPLSQPELGTLGGTDFTLTTQTFFPPNREPRPTPEWIGEGPANYNSLTWPQLLSELGSIAMAGGIINVISFEENYRYLISTIERGANIGSWSDVGVNFSEGSRSVQIYNPSLSSFITVGYSVTTRESAIARVIDPDPDPSFPDEVSVGAIAESWAEIRTLNNYPSGVMGVHYPSYQRVSDFDIAGTGSVVTVSVSIVDSVEIPPGKSAFIGIRTHVTGHGIPLAIGDWSTTINISEISLTHGEIYPA